MKAYAIISVARQVNGEIVVVKPEKAFTDKIKATEYYTQLMKKYMENIESPNGPIQCVCERAVFEMEIEE